MGLGSVGLGIGATAVILQSWPASGVAPKAVLDLGSFRASLMTSTKSVSMGQVILIAPIWADRRPEVCQFRLCSARAWKDTGTDEKP
jgi:hypothetical protein